MHIKPTCQTVCKKDTSKLLKIWIYALYTGIFLISLTCKTIFTHWFIPCPPASAKNTGCIQNWKTYHTGCKISYFIKILKEHL